MGQPTVEGLRLAIQRVAMALPPPPPDVARERVTDLRCVAYRLLFAVEADARGAVVTVEEACEGLALATVPAALLARRVLRDAAAALTPTGRDGSACQPTSPKLNPA